MSVLSYPSLGVGCAKASPGAVSKEHCGVVQCASWGAEGKGARRCSCITPAARKRATQVSRRIAHSTAHAVCAGPAGLSDPNAKSIRREDRRRSAASWDGLSAATMDSEEFHKFIHDCKVGVRSARPARCCIRFVVIGCDALWSTASCAPQLRRRLKARHSEAQLENGATHATRAQLTLAGLSADQQRDRHQRLRHRRNLLGM